MEFFFWFDSKGIPNPYYNLRNIRVWIYQDKIVVMKFTNVRIFAFELARMKPGRSVEMRDTERNHFYILFRHFQWLFDSLLPFRQVRYIVFVIQKFSAVWINAVQRRFSHIAMSDLYNGDFIVFIRFHCIKCRAIFHSFLIRNSNQTCLFQMLWTFQWYHLLVIWHRFRIFIIRKWLLHYIKRPSLNVCRFSPFETKHL